MASSTEPNGASKSVLAASTYSRRFLASTPTRLSARDGTYPSINAYKLKKAEEELDSLLVRDAPSPPKYSFIRSSILGGTNARARVDHADAPDNEDKIQAFRQRDELEPSEGLTIYASGKKGYTTRSTRKHEAPDAEMVKDLITSRPSKVGWLDPPSWAARGPIARTLVPSATVASITLSRIGQRSMPCSSGTRDYTMVQLWRRRGCARRRLSKAAPRCATRSSSPSVGFEET